MWAYFWVVLEEERGHIARASHARDIAAKVDHPESKAALVEYATQLEQRAASLEVTVTSPGIATVASDPIDALTSQHRSGTRHALKQRIAVGEGSERPVARARLAYTGEW